MTVEELKQTYATAYKNGRMLTPQEFNQMMELLIPVEAPGNVEGIYELKEFKPVSTIPLVTDSENPIIKNLNERVQALETYLAKVTNV